MDGVSVTVLDILVVGVILLSAVFAMWRGLIQETLSIVAWVAAAYSALRFHSWLQPFVEDYISSPKLAAIAAGAIIFLIVLIPISFLSHRFGEKVKQSQIGPVDRSLGFVFGIARGLVLVAIAYIAFTALVPIQDHPDWLKNARLLPLIQSTSDVLLSLVPDRNLDTNTVDSGAENNTESAEKPKDDKDTKTYGARERHALDRLIEATGNDKGSPQ